ncbi:MAG TPA: Rho termination factor N-terminal domain-containing protein, partial [Bacilli bacterium]|nr:Rho termination factor N-terminal domain-containing protein [Bacilli bacterium]
MKELLKKLSFLNGKDLADFFKKFKLMAPKALRVDVLREAMAPKVEEQLANTSGGFGIGGQNNYRLLWFAKLSEHQLEKYLSTFDDPELDNKYHNLLVEKMLAYAAEKKVKKADMEELVAASEDNYRRVGHARLDMEEFNNSLDAVFYDEKSCCDGLSVSEFRGVLFNVGTREELFEIAAKYEIKVPERLNKDELLAYCVRQMKIEKYYTAEAEAALSEMTAKDLREWAKNHNIQSGSQLNKKDLIEYILSDYSKTKEDYEVPKDDSVYEMAIPLPYGQEEVDVEALEAKIAELTAEKEKLEKAAAKSTRENNRNKKKI